MYVNTNRVWQSQDHKHNVFQHLYHPAQVQAGQQAQQQQEHHDSPAQQGLQVILLNWSYFKPEFPGKPDKDAEAHLLCTNDWMNTHHFVEGVKIQRFCLTLLGEARLWYQSLEPINGDWQGLQNLFRQQYSKIGNTREQLFHVWKSFSFDENTETIDPYVTHIRQVATLLGYGEPQILEAFKNKLPTKLYWIVFPIDDLRQAVETAKRILTKEVIDRQLYEQSSSTTFISIKDNHGRRVSFDTKKELGDKIDKLTVMIGKLAARGSGSGRQFKPQIYQGKCKDKIEVTMTDAFMISKVIKKEIGQIVKTRDSIYKTEADLGMNKIIGEEILEVTWGCTNTLKEITVEESMEIITEMKVMGEVEIGTGLEKGQFLETLVVIETIGVSAAVGPGQDQG